MRIPSWTAGAAGAALIVPLLLAGPGQRAQDPVPPDQVAQFTDDGALVRPTGWESWVMVGASIGLSYNEGPARAAGEAPGIFHNVFLQPWAYRRALETGEFPDGAMFVLSFYQPSQKATPARRGFYEGDQLPGFEVHVKKAGVDSTGWAFYNFGDSSATAAKVPSAAPCYACHAKEAAHDNVFTQFYPQLRQRLAKGAP
jgi:hypothetical protein